MFLEYLSIEIYYAVFNIIYKKYISKYSQNTNILSKDFKGIKFNMSNLYTTIFNNRNFDFYNINDYKSISDISNNNQLQALQILINDTKINYLHNIISFVCKSQMKNVIIDIENTTEMISLTIQNSNNKIENYLLPYHTIYNNYFLIFKRALKVRFEILKDDKIIQCEDTPIYKNNRVVDIIREINIIDENVDNFTDKFQILIDSKGNNNIE